MSRRFKILTNGIFKENPVLVLVLGICPTLAISSNVINSLGMGVATMLALVLSNMLVSLLKNYIPAKVRIPCYIVVISGTVTALRFLCEAYAPDLYEALGVYLPLIAVNCIILGRAEMFARKNGVIDSMLDGLGMGLGFTLALFCMGAIRELLGAGTFMNIRVTADLFDPIVILGMAPGGFFVFGCLIALVNKVTKGGVHRTEFGCGNCPAADSCAAACEGEQTP